MTYEEISKVLEINGKESDIFLPNEIFSDLQPYITDSSHIAYAYSYTYLTHFLYRNYKYLYTQKLLDGNVIKKILGYSQSNRTMNYITKKGGLLDEHGYTKSTKNYPNIYQFEEGFASLLAAESIGDVLPLVVPKMFFLKYPLLAFDRVLKLEVEGQIEEKKIAGTFFDKTNTHSVPFKVFLYCMSNKELGVIAFYLFCWFKYRNDMFGGGYDVPLSKLSKETGIKRRSLIKYMDLLKGYRMIDFIHNQNFFVLGALKEDRKATKYIANDINNFSEEHKSYKKMDVQLREEYFKLKAEQEEKMKGTINKVNIRISELLF